MKRIFLILIINFTLLAIASAAFIHFSPANISYVIASIVTPTINLTEWQMYKVNPRFTFILASFIYGIFMFISLDCFFLLNRSSLEKCMPVEKIDFVEIFTMRWNFKLPNTNYIPNMEFKSSDYNWNLKICLTHSMMSAT